MRHTLAWLALIMLSGCVLAHCFGGFSWEGGL
jgi:hypothetical protein